MKHRADKEAPDEQIVLTAHGLGEPPDGIDSVDPEMWIDTARFEALLDMLSPGVTVTFDDGFHACFDLALPALQRRGLVASFFVTTGYIGKPGYLGVDELRVMQEAGMGIGLHGKGHRPWRRLEPDAMREEIFQAQDELQQILGAPVTEAACPFGAYDRRSLAALRQAGMTRVYTSDRLPARRGSWLVPRYTLRASEPAEYWVRILNGHEPDFRLPRQVTVAVKSWR